MSAELLTPIEVREILDAIDLEAATATARARWDEFAADRLELVDRGLEESCARARVFYADLAEEVARQEGLHDLDHVDEATLELAKARFHGLLLRRHRRIVAGGA